MNCLNPQCPIGCNHCTDHAKFLEQLRKPLPVMGMDLIKAGNCPRGALSPMACMFCSTGHMTECHYPMSCGEAQCSHFLNRGSDQ